MTFEEAWPHGATVTFGRPELEVWEQYISLCTCQKNKDAAGLGSLAYALSEGDRTVLADDEGDWHIRVVAKAIKERDKFWSWLSSEAASLDADRRLLIKKAHDSSKRAGWPWDKAFTYAGALLALWASPPKLALGHLETTKEFPYWTAIDKHTRQGKEVLREIAKEQGLPASTVLWLSFYLESAACNDLAPSPWWEREKQWRMSNLALSLAEAAEIWSQLRPLVAERLREAAEDIERRVRPHIGRPWAIAEVESITSSSQRTLF